MKKFGFAGLMVMVLAGFGIATAGDSTGDSAMMRMMRPTHEFGYVGASSAWLSLSGFNTFLNSQGLSSFPEQAWTIAFGGYKDYDRLVMEHTFSIRIWGFNRNGPLRTTLVAADLTGNTGFNTLPPQWPASLYPYVGLGVGMNALYVRDDSKTFSQMLASTEPNSYSWEFTPLLNLGLGSNYLLLSPDKTMGLALGLRAGFLVDLYYTKRWISDGVYITDIPSISQTGAYVRLIIAGWGKHKHHHRTS